MQGKDTYCPLNFLDWFNLWWNHFLFCYNNSQPSGLFNLYRQLVHILLDLTWIFFFKFATYKVEINKRISSSFFILCHFTPWGASGKAGTGKKFAPVALEHLNWLQQFLMGKLHGSGLGAQICRSSVSQGFFLLGTIKRTEAWRGQSIQRPLSSWSRL